MPAPSRTRVVALTIAALVGFAANSLLCRRALAGGAIDAASFTAIRLAAGALVLFVLARGVAWDARGDQRRAGSWASGAALFAYAAAFSFAYLRLTTATGALILFATVQATMIGWAIVRGDRPRALEWLGIAVAASGLVVLTLPGLATPDPLGALLMAAAGASWGVYSLRGRGAKRPLAATADNFARTLPMAAVLLAGWLTWQRVDGATTGGITPAGVALAASSGALASGVGYSLWYAALPHLAPARAAIVQLSVPVLAAGGGAVLLGEPVGAQLVVAAATIVGGIALAVVAKRR